MPRYRRVGESRALRALLRLLQYSAGDVRRCARVSAGYRAGIRRHHPARRQAALRVLRGDGAEGHRDHAQGLRRRLRRHVVQTYPRRFQFRLSERGNRGDGSGAARSTSFFGTRSQKAKDPWPRRARLVEEYRKTFANPFKAAELGYIDEVIMPHDTRAAPDNVAQGAARTSAKRIRRAKHGNIPL